jgi:cell division inhibitor SepF
MAVGIWQRMKVALGLEDDWDTYEDEYDDEALEPEEDIDFERSSRGRAYHSPYGGESTSVRRVERDFDEPEPRRRSSLRSVPTGPGSVTPVSPQVRIAIVEPKTFGEAQSIADKFKQGTPVVMNMTYTKPDLAKRLIDFASGLTYGLDGGLQKVSEKVFLLTPENVDVSAEDRRRLKDTGLFTLEM